MRTTTTNAMSTESSTESSTEASTDAVGNLILVEVLTGALGAAPAPAEGARRDMVRGPMFSFCIHLPASPVEVDRPC